MKIGIFTGATSVRSKNIFTHISPYPTGKHEIMCQYWCEKARTHIGALLTAMIINQSVERAGVASVKRANVRN